MSTAGKELHSLPIGITGKTPGEETCPKCSGPTNNVTVTVGAPTGELLYTGPATQCIPRGHIHTR